MDEQLPDGNNVHIGGQTDAETAEDVAAPQSAACAATKADMRRRERTMRTSRNIFRAIDILFSPTQNNCPYINKTNVGTIRCTEDVVYNDKFAGVCKLDIYDVASEDRKPAVMLIHGGGFSAGGKQYRRGIAQYYAVNGFKTFCVDYGLAPDYVFPAPLLQLVDAANFIYDRADEYGIDRDRIFLAGDSAGAYYAAMLGTLNCESGRIIEKEFGAHIRFGIFGLMLNCGLYDIETAVNTKFILNLDDGVYLNFTGMEKIDFPGYKYKDICMPTALIDGNYPPTYLAFAPNDILCKGQGEALISKLESCGVYCEYYRARHGTSNHCFPLNWRGEDAVAANELMMSFAKRLANGKIRF